MLPESRAFELDFETFNGVIKNRNLKISTRVSMTKLECTKEKSDEKFRDSI